MRENVTIVYRGASYELGRGPRFYGIWAAGTPQAQPVEWWPETPEGWHGAWSRFTQVEAPATIAAVSQPAAVPGQRAAPLLSAGTQAITAATLLLVGVACGVAGLFPAYVAGASLAHDSVDLVPHVIYLAAWSASALLIMLGGTRQRVGALVGLGTSAVTFGLFLSDAGTATASGAHLVGAGLILGSIGWLACAAGSVVAFRIRSADAPARPGARAAAPVLTWALAGAGALGAVIAFAPSWEKFTLRTATVTQSVKEGYAFANPGLVIAGDVAVMAAFVALVALAALWHPIRLGAALLAGAIIPMAAQAISALIQAGQPATPAQFGFSAAGAAQAGLTISSGLTPAFWIFCAFLIILAVACTRMALPPRPAPASPAPAAPAAPAVSSQPG